MQDQNITLILSNLILECTLNLWASELSSASPRNQTDLTSLVLVTLGQGLLTHTKAEPAPSKLWRSREEPYA